MNSIGEECNSLRTDSLNSFVGNPWATGGLRVNSTSGDGRDLSDPLFAYTGLKCKGLQSVQVKGILNLTGNQIRTIALVQKLEQLC